MVKGAQTVQRVISRYHRAIEKKDAATALSCLSKSYYRAGRGESGAANDPTRWGVSQTPSAALRKWISQESYKCAIEFLHTHIDENVAVVVTKEAGSFTSEGKTHSWKGVTNLWFLAKNKGDWKITSSIHYID